METAAHAGPADPVTAQEMPMNAEPDITFNAGGPQGAPFSPQGWKAEETQFADPATPAPGGVDRDALAEVWDYLSKH